MSPEEQERQRRERESTRQSQIAQSRATTANFGGAAGGGGGPAVQKQKNPLQDIGMQLGKAALGSALGPLGGVLGGLFNNGGKVPMQGYNQGGQTNRFGRQITKPARTQTTAQQSKGGGGWFSWMNPNRKKLQDMGLNHRGVKRNMGGPISSNPHGYNEGGQAIETPMKKVMDEDKIELARMAAMRAEERKDMKFQADEKRAQEKHDMDMKMKKQASVTKKAPLASK